MSLSIPPNFEYIGKTTLSQIAGLAFLPARMLFGGREIVAIVHSDVKNDVFTHTYRFVESKTPIRWIGIVVIIICLIPGTLLGIGLTVMADHFDENLVLVKREFAKWRPSPQLPAVVIHPSREDLVKSHEHYIEKIDRVLEYSTYLRGWSEMPDPDDIEEPMNCMLLRPMTGDGGYVFGAESPYYDIDAWEFLRDHGQEKTIVLTYPKHEFPVLGFSQYFEHLRQFDTSTCIATSFEAWPD